MEMWQDNILVRIGVALLMLGVVAWLAFVGFPPPDSWAPLLRTLAPWSAVFGFAIVGAYMVIAPLAE